MKARWIFLTVVFSVLVSTLGHGQFQQEVFTPINVSNSGVACLNEDNCRPAMVARNGDIYVAWIEEDADGNLSTVRFSRSDNEGDTFTEPVTIAEASGFNVRDVSLKLLPNEDLILVWADDRNNNFDVFVTLSNDEGDTWEWDANNPVLNLSDNDGDSLSPAVDSGILETFVVVWSDDTEAENLNPDGARNIFVRAGRADDASLTETFNVSKGFLSTIRFPSERPAIAINPNRPLRSMFIAWEQEGNRFKDILFHQTSGFNPFNISNSDNSESQRVAIALRSPVGAADIERGQQVIAVWEERVGSVTQILLNIARDADLFLADPGFGEAPLDLSQAQRSASAPAITVNEQNHFFIAWHQEDRNNRNRSLVRLVAAVDVLGLPQRVSQEATTLSATNVALAADANNVYIVWLEENLDTEAQDIVFTRRQIRRSNI